jgi:hypothetical protein
MLLEQFRGFYKGSEGCIVGKGPSLEFLSERHFGGGPIVVINDAIRVVERLKLSNTIFSMQRDGVPEIMVRPEGAILVLQSTPGYSGLWYPDYGPRLTISPCDDFGFSVPCEMSIRVAIAFALCLGCSSLSLLCCDSLANGDFRTYNTKTGKVFPGTGDGNYAAVVETAKRDLSFVKHYFVTPQKAEE